jgi:hypothetical protein
MTARNCRRTVPRTSAFLEAGSPCGGSDSWAVQAKADWRAFLEYRALEAQSSARRRHRRGRARQSVGAEARTHSLRTEDARPTGFHL